MVLTASGCDITCYFSRVPSPYAISFARNITLIASFGLAACIPKVGSTMSDVIGSQGCHNCPSPSKTVHLDADGKSQSIIVELFVLKIVYKAIDQTKI